MYRIRFSPCSTHYPDYNDSESHLQCHRVYSDDIDLIYRFLYQHNFDPNASIIENLSEKEANDEDVELEMHLLTVKKLWSNDDKKFHEVVTSDYLFELAVDYVAEELEGFLLFGPTILRRDIQVIDIITHCLETIPFCTILDLQLLEDDLLNDLSDNSWKAVKKRIDQIKNHHNHDVYDNAYLYAILYDSCHYDKIMPITLEAYVKSFVDYVVKPDMK